MFYKSIFFIFIFLFVSKKKRFRKSFKKHSCFHCFIIVFKKLKNKEFKIGFLKLNNLVHEFKEIKVLQNLVVTKTFLMLAISLASELILLQNSRMIRFIATLLVLRGNYACSSSTIFENQSNKSGNVFVLIFKDFNSSWISPDIESCIMRPCSRNVAIGMPDDYYKSGTFFFFSSCNHTTAQEILLELIIGNMYQRSIDQSRNMIIATNVDEVSTTLIIDIIAPYQNIILLDVNFNNYNVNYRSNSFPQYIYPPSINFFDFIVSDLKVKNIILIKLMMNSLDDEKYYSFETTAKYPDLCITEFIFNYKNISSISFSNIMKEITLNKKLKQLFILFNGISSPIDNIYIIDLLLEACTNLGITIETIFFGNANAKSNYRLSKYDEALLLWRAILSKHENSFTNIFLNINHIDSQDVLLDQTCDIICHFYNSINSREINWVQVFPNLGHLILKITWNGEQSRMNVKEIFDENEIIEISERIATQCDPLDCSPGFEQKLKFGVLTEVKKERKRFCVLCTENSYKNSYGSQECQRCPPDFVSNFNRTACEDPFKIDYLKTSDLMWGLTIALAAFNFLCGVFIESTFLYNRNTAIVKSAHFTLSMIQITFHLLVSVSIPLLYLSKTVLLACSIRHIFVGFLFTTIASVTFIKTRKYVKIFTKVYRFSNKEKFVATSLDVIIITFMLMVQSLLGTIFLTKSPPLVRAHLDNEKWSRTFYCSTDSQLAFQVIYIGFVLFLCLVQSFKARNLPSYFNETSAISYSTGTSCILLICYFPIYYGNNNLNTQTAAVSTLLLTINLILMTVMFFPKILMIYFRPETNTQTSIQTQMKEYSKAVFVLPK